MSPVGGGCGLSVHPAQAAARVRALRGQLPGPAGGGTGGQRGGQQTCWLQHSSQPAEGQQALPDGACMLKWLLY